MIRIQNEMREIIQKEKGYQILLKDAFKGIDYGIK